MTSAINPNNIDGAYPVAGQDNNSQGFRDNFTNIKTNFQSAAEEITDLQSKVVLKAALTGSALDNNLNNNTIYAVNLNDVSTTRTAVTATSGAISINYATGQYQTINTTGSITLAFTNFPAAGFYGCVRLAITVNNTGYTVSLPAAVSQGLTGLQGYSAGTITFGATGTYVFDFASSDGGSTITITDVSRPLNVYTNPLFLTGSEDLAAAAAASLSKTTSYFSTSAAETATLAAGADGQVKVFAMAADSGDMVITVTNAGWKTSGTGTITFNDIGDACTLLYTNSKWYCIGNNGCAFA
jgi:hypothetical protein